VPIGGRAAACAFVACLQAMTSACAARVPPDAATVTRKPDPVPDPPISVAVAPDPPPVAPPPAPDRRSEITADPCALIPEAGEPVVTVGLSDPIEPSNAPRPTNEGERMLFRQLYETLVRADCNGRAAPGLAASWQLDANGRTWLLTLRENARFSDGMPVTAADVWGSWTLAGGEQLRPHVSRLLESVAVAGDRALAITPRRQGGDAPLTLAHPDLAIAKAVADSPWPLGTRSSRIAPGRAPGTGTTTAMTVARDGLPDLRFVVAPGDPRDLLDAGVDLLLTRDPAALDYAATLPHVQSVPLAWQRTYVLLTPGRARASPPLSEDQRRVLAGDAVRGEAQGARGPFWWQALPDCEAAPSPPSSRPSPTTRVVYDARDGAARDLAERLVGVGTFQRAAGLTGTDLARARRLGADAGYVIALESRPLDACRDLLTLIDGSRWLDPKTIVPLVETRLRAVVRQGRSGLIVEWDGGVVIAGGSGPR
jgi:hypothetical protein